MTKDEIEKRLNSIQRYDDMLVEDGDHGYLAIMKKCDDGQYVDFDEVLAVLTLDA